jgi:hypothetical protein
MDFDQSNGADLWSRECRGNLYDGKDPHSISTLSLPGVN